MTAPLYRFAPRLAALEVDLLPPGSAFAAAFAALDRRGAAARLDPVRVVELYAYEVFERALEWSRRADLATSRPPGGAVLRAPFEPAALMAAVGGDPTFVAGLGALRPAARRIWTVLPSDAASRTDFARAAAAEAAELFGPVLGRAIGPAAVKAATTPAPDGLTATAGVALLRDGQVLLERRPATSTLDPGVWDTPGGKLEAGETPVDAAVREIREELGLRLDPAELRLRFAAVERDCGGVPTRARHEFSAVAPTTAPRSLTGTDLRWFALAEAAALEDLGDGVRAALRSFSAPHDPS